MKDPIRKNLLDIQYQRYLSYFNTSIIVSFTYLIAVFIGFLTKQIDLTNITHIYALTSASLLILIPSTMVIINSLVHKDKIIKELKKLRKENIR